jgi:hypothetical protein
VEEWKLYSKNNQDKYARELDCLQPPTSDRIKASMKSTVASMYSGKLNVPCPSGIADVVTREYVVEVGPLSEWKQAIGNAQIYSIDMNLKPTIYLFTVNTAAEASYNELRHIRPHCKRLGVIILNDLHKPCLFDKLSKEALLNIVMFTLTIDIRSVLSLAINKRVWDLTSAIWPTIARSQLQASPRPLHPEELIKTFLAMPNKYPSRTLALYSRSCHRVNRHIITIEAYDNEMTIALHDFIVSLVKYRWKYVAHSSEQRTGERNILGTPVTKTVSSAVARGHYRTVQLFLTRVLPELADSIDIRC